MRVKHNAMCVIVNDTGLLFALHIVNTVNDLRCHIRSPVDIRVCSKTLYVKLVSVAVKGVLYPHLKTSHTRYDISYHAASKIFFCIFTKEYFSSKCIAKRKSIRCCLCTFEHIKDLVSRQIWIDSCDMHCITVTKLCKTSIWQMIIA